VLFLTWVWARARCVLTGSTFLSSLDLPCDLVTVFVTSPDIPD